jgi:hypothetical protein
MSGIERFDDVMLDIETMSTDTSNALILSIGILHFDPKPDDGPVFGARWLLRPDIRPQLRFGRSVEKSTQKFWGDQPQEAADDWMLGPIDSLLAVSDEIAEATKDCKRLWAHGVVFDLGNVASLLGQAGFTVPWHYRAPRCARQLVTDHAKIRLVAPLDVLGRPHEALYDCHCQAISVWQHWPTAEHVPHHSV